MTTISPKKIEDIRNKVIPHLQKALDYLNNNSLIESEGELVIAETDLQKEKIRPPELWQNLAELYNNLGAKHLIEKNVEKAFKLLSKSLKLKIECDPRNIPSVEGTFRNMFKAALLCCEFEDLSNTIKDLLDRYTNEQKFKDYLERCQKITARVQNNEPGIFIANMRLGSFDFSRSIDLPIYFPKAFEDIEIDLKSQLILSDHATLNCCFTMSTENLTNIPVPYEIDSWKRERPLHTQSRIRNPTPNLIILLSENEHIPRNTINVRDKSGNAIEFDFRTVFSEFFVADSYPRFGDAFGDPPEIPHCKSFKYFRGKAGVLEWEMKVDDVYTIELDMKNYGKPLSANSQLSMKIGILTPFRRVKFDSSVLRYTSKIAIENIQQKRIEYFKDREGPGVISLQAEPNSISDKQFFDGLTPRVDAERKLYDITPEPEIIFDDYAIFALSFCYRILPENLSISTFEWEQPIPTALSHLLMDQRFSFPPLCQYSIINNSKKEVVLTIATEVEGFTNKQEDSKIILPYSIEYVNHTPSFKLNTINLRETCVANLKTRAAIGDEIVAQKTRKIELLAFDTMIWEILNPLTRENLGLHNFVVVWVTPHDKEVENVLSIAKEKHPSRTLQGYPSDLPPASVEESVNLQCKAILQALNSIGISYVDSSISFGWLEPYLSQRIKLPFTTIETKAANCIDGTVLFASLLENIGIQAIIILVPGHALVGWRPCQDSKRIALLETTQIAFADFETSMRCGRESLNKALDNIRKTENKPFLTIQDAVRMGHIRFVDVSRMRENKVFPNVHT